MTVIAVSSRYWYRGECVSLFGFLIGWLSAGRVWDGMLRRNLPCRARVRSFATILAGDTDGIGRVLKTLSGAKLAHITGLYGKITRISFFAA